MIKINQNEKDEIQAWISMLSSPDPEAWQLAKSLIWSSSFYKRNKGILDTLLYLCWECTDRSVYFNDTVEWVTDTRWELIQIFNELLDQKYKYGCLIDGSLINIEYETN